MTAHPVGPANISSNPIRESSRVRVGRYRPPAGRVCHLAASVAGGVAAPNAG